jgi:hypothetical protein
MTVEDPIKERLGAIAGTEVFPCGIIPAGDVTVSTGDTGIAGGAGAGVEVVGIGVCVAMGLSGSIHPAIVITRMRKPIRKIPE